jgi:hypothetical protein
MTAFASLLAIAAAVPERAGAQDVDSITVVEIRPSTPLKRGVPSTVSLDLDVTLRSMDIGEVVAAFNTQGPKLYPKAASTRVRRGKQRITLTATVAAVDWSSQAAEFAYVVNIRPIGVAPDARGRTPGYATVRGTIKVVP